MNEVLSTQPSGLNEVKPKTRFLTRVLIAKSVLDVLVLGTISLSFYYSAFNPNVRGSLDEAGPEFIRGWVLDLSKRDRRLEVQLYVDGRFVESRVADFPSPQLVVLGFAPDERHGFFFYTPPLDAGAHQARVYAVHESAAGERRTLQQLGKAISFETSTNSAEPFFKGWVDIATPVTVRGWVVDKAAPRQSVEVQLYIDGRFIESRVADYERPDLKSGGLLENDRVGFIFLTPTLLPGEHEVRVYAVSRSGEAGRSLRLIGRPLKFTMPAPASQ